MRVSLVQAPAFDPNTPSNGLALLAAHLKAVGADCRVHDASKNMAKGLSRALDLDFSDSRVFPPALEQHPDVAKQLLDLEAADILSGHPDVVGFSVLARTEQCSLRLADAIKAKEPRCHVVFGGAQCLRENLAFEFIRHPSVDAVALGEADLSFPAFVRGLTRGNGPVRPARGMLTKRNGQIVDGGEPEAVPHLDRLPFLDFSFFDLEEYRGDTLFLSTTRGCVRQCSFCTHIVGQKVYRTMSAARTAAEIRHQLRRYPRRNVVEFTDSLINGDVQRLARLCNLLIEYRLDRAVDPYCRRGFGWTGMAILHSTMTPALLRKMRHSGCVELRYGFESGSQKVLDSMRKRVDLRDAEAVIRNTHRAGIAVFLFTLVGFPTETETDFQMTLAFLERNARFISKVIVSTCEIQKGAHLDVHPEMYGLRTPLEDRLRWETKSGDNTYAIRQDRVKRLDRLLGRLGLQNHELPTRLGLTLKSPEPHYDFYPA